MIIHQVPCEFPDAISCPDGLMSGCLSRQVMDESPTDRGNLAKAKRRIKQEQQKIQLPRSSVIAGRPKPNRNLWLVGWLVG